MKHCPRCPTGKMLRDYYYHEACVNCGYYDQPIALPLTKDAPSLHKGYRRDVRTRRERYDDLTRRRKNAAWTDWKR